MCADTLSHLLGDLEALGLCGSNSEPSGLGPWESVDAESSDTAAPISFTLLLLARLARANTAISFLVHQRSLARAIARRVGLIRSDHGPLAVAFDGRHGLGRVPFARALSGVELTDDDCAMLADAYAPDAARVLPLDPAFAGLLTPVFTGDVLTFQLHARADLDIAVDAHAHGLDELITATVRPRNQGATADLNSDDARRFFVKASAAHQLALVAMAAGAVDRVHRLAQRFASQRAQGGSTIDRHAAVLGLLGRSRATLHTTFAQLKAFVHVDDLPAALALRTQAQPALADAANAALQVFGGLGYMRDTGAEKVVRDVNCMRALAGSPRELLLVVAEWERIHA